MVRHALFAALAQQSPTSDLPAGEALTVPGMLALPQNAGTLRIPCPVRATDTLTAIAARFAYAGDALNRLGLDNEALGEVLAVVGHAALRQLRELFGGRG